MRSTIIHLGILLALAGAPAIADPGDPPSRVARLNYLSGQVSFRPGSVEDWAAASLNYPLTSGDHLWTDAGAQTEMHIGSTAVRMAPETALAILNLDDRTVQLSLTQGAVNVHVRFLGPDEIFEVDTPSVSITLVRPGDYRIDADGDHNMTAVAVRGGEAQVNGGGASFAVEPRQSAQIAGLDSVSQEIGPLPPPNGFDNWCALRDRREEQSISASHVGREMTGYEDLDEHGVWREVPGYGWVWAPNTVAVGWAPYRYGHWAWIEPWGWTWVDDASWGFAPFHYGRWAMVGGGWVWVPGTMVARPVYAPALVAFVGGPRFGVSLAIGGGGVAAWFPLGPREPYIPAYHVSQVYVQQVNISHVTVTNINVVNVRYANQNVVGAVTAVPHDAFVGARSVHQAAIVLPPGEMARAQVIGATAPMAPRRESVLAGPVRAGGPPARFADRQVVVRNAPPPPPVSFAAKQRALEANPGRPVDPGTLNALRGQGAPARNPMVRSVAAPQEGNAPAARPAAGILARPQAGSATPPVRESLPRNDRPAPAPAQPRAAEQPHGATPAVRTTAPPARSDPRNAKPQKKPEKKTEHKEEK
jgi:hypothetical protein